MEHFAYLAIAFYCSITRGEHLKQNKHQLFIKYLRLFCQDAVCSNQGSLISLSSCSFADLLRQPGAPGKTCLGRYSLPVEWRGLSLPAPRHYPVKGAAWSYGYAYEMKS